MGACGLVTVALLVRIKSVNEPFVPTVTVPVTLVETPSKIFVAPSATNCPRAPIGRIAAAPTLSRHRRMVRTARFPTDFI